jgi:hypothetical protein
VIPEARRPRVFISYSRDSEQHIDDVLQLAEQLRSHDIEVRMDEDLVAPPEGWMRWVLKEIEAADVILVIATEGYLARINAPPKPHAPGAGVNWELDLIYQNIYNVRETDRIVPVVLDPGMVKYIPLPLQRFQRYDLSSPRDMEHLIERILTRRGSVERTRSSSDPLRPTSLRSARSRFGKSRLSAAVACILALAPPVFVWISGFGVPPELRYELIFPAVVGICTILWMLCLWVTGNDASQFRAPVRSALVLIATALASLMTYIGVFEYCVQRHPTHGTVYFPLWTSGRLSDIVRAAGGRWQALDRYGEYAVQSTIAQMPPFAIAATTTLLLVLLVATCGAAMKAIWIVYLARNAAPRTRVISDTPSALPHAQTTPRHHR